MTHTISLQISRLLTFSTRIAKTYSGSQFAKQVILATMICKFNYIFILKNLNEITQRENAYVRIKTLKLTLKGLIA